MQLVMSRWMVRIVNGVEVVGLLIFFLFCQKWNHRRDLFIYSFIYFHGKEAQEKLLACFYSNGNYSK